MSEWTALILLSKGPIFYLLKDLGCFSLKLLQLWLYLFLHMEPKLHIIHILNYWVIPWRWSRKHAPLSLLYHPGVCDCHFSIHFFQRQINVPITQGQANERFLVKEASLTDDRKADGRVSWQGLRERGGRVACWEAEPRWNSGCCGQGHGCSPGRGSSMAWLLLVCGV